MYDVPAHGMQIHKTKFGKDLAVYNWSKALQALQIISYESSIGE